MSTDSPATDIRYVGPPQITTAGQEVLSFHLHRYLSGWLRETGCQRVLVTVGFGGASADLGAYRIDVSQGQAVRSGWDFSDLHDAWRFGDGRIIWEGPSGESMGFDVVAIVDDEGDQGARDEHQTRDLLGFLTVRQAEELSEEAVDRFRRQAAEAIRVARRNGVRLFFDEQKDLPVKALIYSVMDRIPEWLGCDHSAAMMVTHDLDAVTLEDTTEGIFNVLAERLYAGESTGDRDRLVGMTVEAASRERTLLSDAIERHRQEPTRSYLRYERDGDGKWRVDDGEPELHGWHAISDRRPDQTIVLVPLVHRSHGERDLLGFLSLSWAQSFALPPSARDILEELGTNLARLVRQSPLYTMSVRKMWVIRQVRDRIEAAIDDSEPGEEAMESVIGAVSELVAQHVDVPSFAIGYLVEADGGRALRYAHPHGWTRFDDLDLDVDVAADGRVDSGVSALAVRLKRPVILAGGHGEGAAQSFKNHLWVDEEKCEIFDARATGVDEARLRQSCRPLREYYKPARESAYATLAYPMEFSNILIGVLTVEVEKSTDWLWWTGFGGHLFWDMIAREVAMGLVLLRASD